MDLTIIFASQTGTASDLAEQFRRLANRRNFRPAMFSISDYPVQNLINEKLVVFFCSTTGDGDMPDTMKPFWEFILRKNLPNNILETLKFTVFGLGDSSYEKFNAAARKLRARLLQLGANEIFEIGLGDDESVLGVEGDFDVWARSLFALILSFPEYKLPVGCIIDDGPRLEVPFLEKIRIHVSNLTIDEASSFLEDERNKFEKIRHNINNGLLLRFDDLYEVSFDDIDESKISLPLSNTGQFKNEKPIRLFVSRNEVLAKTNELNDNTKNKEMDKDVRLLEFSMHHHSSIEFLGEKLGTDAMQEPVTHSQIALDSDSESILNEHEDTETDDLFDDQPDEFTFDETAAYRNNIVYPEDELSSENDNEIGRSTLPRSDLNNENLSDAENNRAYLNRQNTQSSSKNHYIPRKAEPFYETGDILIFPPKNESLNVELMLKRLKLPGSLVVSLCLKNGITFGPCSIFELLASLFDFSKPVSRGTLEILYFCLLHDDNSISSGAVSLEEEREKFLEFMQPENNDLFQSYIKREKRGLLHLMQDFSFDIPFIYIPYRVLHPMKHREYSICSCPTYDRHDRVKIVVSMVKYLTPTKRLNKGLCSEYFSNINLGESVEVYLKRSLLTLPQDDLDTLVLIGPGTGIAPFRALAADNLRGQKVENLFILFGCRRVDEDFLFRDDWFNLLKAYSSTNVSLTLLVAFSRQTEAYSSNFFVCSSTSLSSSTTAEEFAKLLPVRVLGSNERRPKMYVQNLLQHPLLKSKLSKESLELGRSAIYICGTAKKMPTNVKECLLNQLEVSEEYGKKMIKDLERNHKIIVESWS